MQYTTVHSRIEGISGQYPQRVAIEEGGRSLTYAEISRHSNRLAHTILALSHEMQEPVAVVMPSGMHLIISLLSIFKAGHVYLPVGHDASINRFEQVLQQCRPGILITTLALEQAVKEKLQQTDHEVEYLLVLHEEMLTGLYHISGNETAEIHDPAEGEEAEVPVMVSEEDNSYIFYTSGSTGNAKAILGTHKGLYHFIDWEATTFGTAAATRVSNLIHPTFDASLRDIFLPLCTGGCLFIPSETERENVSKLISWIEDRKITLIHCVPSLFRLITRTAAGNNAGASFRHLTHILVSGESLYVKDVLGWRACAGDHTQLVNLYGATETTMIKMYHCIGEVDENNPSGKIPVGKPISNTMVAIINDDRICRTGEIGEIYVKTAYSTRGYFLDETLQQRTFVQNPLVKDRTDIVYRTGDLGRYLKDNIVEVVGRTDQQVKVNGIRVDVTEVEQAILGIEAITGVVVISRENKQQQIDLIAYYTGTQLPAGALREQLQTKLHPGCIPAYYQFMEAFPLTITGKVDRKALPAPDEMILQENDYEAVQNDTERKLEIIWMEILDLKRIGRKISFFQGGGTSLKAIQLISRIYREWGVLIKIADIFSHPNIGDLAQLLDGPSGNSYAAIKPVAESDRYPVTKQQKRLWLLGQLEEKQQAYNMPAVFRLTGHVDKTALAAAFRDVVSRHESLRTTFEMTGDELWQRVAKAGDFRTELEMADVSTASEPVTAAEKLIYGEAAKVFNLEKGPLFRMMLIKLEEHTHWIFINTHHIIADAWSIQIMARDLLACYLFHTGHTAQPPQPLKIQYRDYGAWLHERLLRSADEHRRFWEERFQEAPPALQLPLDFARPDKYTFNGQKFHFRFDEKLRAALEEYNRQQNTTLFMVLAGAVNLLLYCRSGQRDIVVGIPFAGRDHQDLEEQIGFYVNVVALRTTLDPDLRLQDFIQQVKQEMLQAHDHSLWPFDSLVSLSGWETDMSRSGFFDVMVQMQENNSRALSLELPDSMDLSQVNLGFNTSKFDLTFNFEKNTAAGELDGWIEYNTGLFLESTVNDIQRALSLILEQIAVHGAGITIRELKKQVSGLRPDIADSGNNRFFNAIIPDDF